MDNLKLLRDPPDTGFEVICDTRTGKKLELVIPVFNEQKRLESLLTYYKEFDIVLLDGGSNDSTVNLAIKSGASVFKRTGRDAGENHFTFYVNKLSKSGICFYMMADEFIDVNNLREAANKLKLSKNVAIFVNKIEWIYCNAQNVKDCKPKSGMLRGVKKGDAGYMPNSLHNGLHYYPQKTSEKSNFYIYNLHHFHIKSIRLEYGKYGRFINYEISAMVENRANFGHYIKRFLVPFFMAFFRGLTNKLSFVRNISRIVELSISIQLAFLVWLEYKFLPNEENQLDFYLSKYSNGADMDNIKHFKNKILLLSVTKSD